jgi:three-Cys-motif partner protein
MKPAEYYVGREQTYVKHLFLEKYLVRVAYNIFSFKSDFVYIDGFSGPWKSEDEEYNDTSFMIALNALNEVQKGMQARGKRTTVRCLFVEKHPRRYAELEQAVQGLRFQDIYVETRCGEFEQLIPEIINFIGSSFSLVFIDPTGWTGFALDRIGPLLRKRGEVLINFMFDSVNRFISDPRPETAATLNPLFGGNEWYDEFVSRAQQIGSREDAIVTVYQERLREFGQLPHVTFTRIKKPTQDRAFFYLVYGTRHWKGLWEFRAVEKNAAPIQEGVRNVAKYRAKETRTGIRDLFSDDAASEKPRSFEEEKDQRCWQAKKRLTELIQDRKRLKYEDIVTVIFEIPLVWPGDLNSWLLEMSRQGSIRIEGMRPHERTPKQGHVIVSTI